MGRRRAPGQTRCQMKNTGALCSLLVLCITGGPLPVSFDNGLMCAKESASTTGFGVIRCPCTHDSTTGHRKIHSPICRCRSRPAAARVAKSKRISLVKRSSAKTHFYQAWLFQHKWVSAYKALCHDNEKGMWCADCFEFQHTPKVVGHGQFRNATCQPKTIYRIQKLSGHENSA